MGFLFSKTLAMKYYKVIPSEISDLEALSTPITLFYSKEIGYIKAKYGIRIHKTKDVPNFMFLKELPFGYVVSNKLKNILKKHHLPAYQFYPIPILKDEQIIQYYWLHWIFDFWYYVDTEKSQLQKQYENQEVFLKKEISFKTLVFKKDFPKYDIFNVDNSEKGIFFSEKLVNRMNENKLLISTLEEPIIINKD